MFCLAKVLENILRKEHVYFENIHLNNHGSSRPEVSCKKRVLENFAKFTEKHLYRSLLFDEIGSYQPFL